jgi:hypothetical protein
MATVAGRMMPLIVAPQHSSRQDGWWTASARCGSCRWMPCPYGFHSQRDIPVSIDETLAQGSAPRQIVLRLSKDVDLRASTPRFKL